MNITIKVQAAIAVTVHRHRLQPLVAVTAAIVRLQCRTITAVQRRGAAAIVHPIRKARLDSFLNFKFLQTGSMLFIVPIKK